MCFRTITWVGIAYCIFAVLLGLAYAFTWLNRDFLTAVGLSATVAGIGISLVIYDYSKPKDKPTTKPKGKK